MTPDTSKMAVTLLTGGIDRSYVFGLVTELLSKNVALEVVGSDELDFPEFRGDARIKFLNSQGRQHANVSKMRKVSRLCGYYARLIRYAAGARPKIFHVLWNNKFEMFDRTLLMLYYKFLGKKIVLTAHNVNAAKRDSRDSWLNRATLRMQYRLANQVFVHNEKAKLELRQDFGVLETAVTVIPFGINNAVPNTALTTDEAKQRLGIQRNKKTLLFFGRITPYKGLEYLIAAFQELLTRGDDYRLIIAGRPENDCQTYWNAMKEGVWEQVTAGRVLLKEGHVPDAETEVYFKAADVLVLPYTQIYQSGVLFLGYSFGLPILATDVGTLKDEIVEAKTGFVFRPRDQADMAASIERYFASDLFANLESRRREIKEFATARHSWDVVGEKTMGVYLNLLQSQRPKVANKDESSAPLLG